MIQNFLLKQKISSYSQKFLEIISQFSSKFRRIYLTIIQKNQKITHSRLIFSTYVKTLWGKANQFPVLPCTSEKIVKFRKFIFLTLKFKKKISQLRINSTFSKFNFWRFSIVGFSCKFLHRTAHKAQLTSNFFKVSSSNFRRVWPLTNYFERVFSKISSRHRD